MDVNEIKEVLRQPIPETTIAKEDYISSGSTLVNLACSGTPYGAFCIGRYFWIVGESSAGKTWLALNSFAEASINPRFDDYDLIYDNVEDGALMDVERYFGQKLADRLEAPMLKNGKSVFSRTAEEFYFNLDDRLQAVEKGKGRKFLYLLDSMDALTTKYEGDKFQEKKNANRKGTVAKGDYGDGKAKINSSYIRGIAQRLRDTDCMMIVLSQTRDNIDAGMFDPDEEVAAGGRALKFYAAFQLWMNVGRRLTKEINGKNRQIGIISKVKVKKNRLTGKEWSVEVPIYWSHGIDNTGSMIDFLIEEKHWPSGRLEAPEFEFAGPKIKLLRKIEEENLEPKLETIVTQVWNEIVRQCVVERKNKYQQF